MIPWGRWVLAGGGTAATVLVAWALYRSVAFPPSHIPAVGEAPVATAAVPAPPKLWVLAIGVSRYATADLDLRFADVDARAVAEAIRHAAENGIYQATHTLVLTNDEVTRESILDAVERFFGEAGPEDVAALFLAGHGVRDLASGSYYFLPHAASAENLVTAGLRMTDFDEMLRVLRRNVRAVVVMMDTCHAGALGIPPARMVSAYEMAGQISAGESFFLLAATKPGEESKEKSDLGHGSFTYAVLEGVRGAADADRDGILSVSELFGYVARRVPILTLNAQHPYHKVEGTDLVFLAVNPGAAVQVASPAQAASEASPAMPVAQPPNAIGVMEFQNLRADAEYDWISKALRVAFNTELSKVRALRVYSPELIDRTVKARGADHLYTARELGIGRLLTGSYHVTDHTLRIDARIIDAATGVNEASDSVEGDLGTFFELQKQLVLSMLRRLRVQVSAEEGASIQTQTNTDVDAYRLLLEAEGVVEPSPPTERPRSTSRGLGPQSRLSLVPAAHAAELDAAVEAQVRAVLEDYRRALEEKNVDRVATLSAAFSARQRAALQGYLQTATDLRVELTDVALIPHETGVVASFTRRDQFIDRETGKPVRLEVRLSKILVRENGTWKIGPGK